MTGIDLAGGVKSVGSFLWNNSGGWVAEAAKVAGAISLWENAKSATDWAHFQGRRFTNWLETDERETQAEKTAFDEYRRSLEIHMRELDEAKRQGVNRRQIIQSAHDQRNRAFLWDSQISALELGRRETIV